VETKEGLLRSPAFPDDLTKILKQVKIFTVVIGALSNGRTTDSGSVCEGSTPSAPDFFMALSSSLV
jgi:hypothetical protein